MELEIGLTWASVSLYLVACVLAGIGLFWSAKSYERWALVPLWVGVVVHAVAIGLRWVRTGHGPYISAFEVLSANVWVGVAIMAVVAVKVQAFRAALGPALSIAALLMGWGVTSSPEVVPLPPSFTGIWLVIHIGFGKIAFGTVLVASGMAAVMLWLEWRGEPGPDRERRLESLDHHSVRLVELGLASMLFMVAAGAIWARSAWGVYWSWDPIETWSLVVLIGYGLFLHVRLTYRVSRRVSAVLIVGLLVLVFIAFFVISLVASTAHTEFMVQ